MIKESFFNAFAKALFRTTNVISIDVPSEHYRLFTLQSAALASVEHTPGDKIQIRVAPMELRTYSPFAWDRAANSFRILAYLHGQGPGSAWAQALKVGSDVQFFGPRGSLPLDLSEPIALFGDETSLGVAASRVWAKPHASDRFVFEVASREEAEAALLAAGVKDSVLIEKSSSHAEDLADTFENALRSSSLRPFFSGRAASIQALRSSLKAKGVLPASKSKAYWAEGKVGLD